LLASGAVLKIQISQPISAIEGILCGTESARCVGLLKPHAGGKSTVEQRRFAFLCPFYVRSEFFQLLMPLRRLSGMVSNAFTPANFS
jgi:hypothetical protein